MEPTPETPEGDVVRDDESRATQRSRRFIYVCVFAVIVLAVDQVSKALALNLLTETERIPILGSFLGLQLAFNPGSLLGLGSQFTWVLTIFSAAAVVVMLFAARRTPSTGAALGLSFILGGAVGNLTDRLISPPGFGRGHVVDFLAYENWFIGNLADVALGIGVFVLAVDLWIRSRRVEPVAHRNVTDRQGAES